MKVTRNALLATGAFMLVLVFANLSGASPFEGSWNVDEMADGRTYSSWLEVKADGSGWFLHRGGHPMPARIEVNGTNIVIQMLPEEADPAPDRKMPSLQGTLRDGQIAGTGLTWRDKSFEWSATRSPDRLEGSDRQVEWGESIDLLAGEGLSNWKTVEERESFWKIDNGLLVNEKSGANLRTIREFRDFKLHVEFMIPKGSNSGIYLRGRYETQVADDFGKEPYSRGVGGIYGRLTPAINATKPAGEWNVVDAQIIGYRVWVTVNGQKTIEGELIPGITGGALNTKEGEPGPIMLQGDHGTVSYRNVVITPAK